eukprot:TRINITY_DN106814_c0_g1_i1.p1 TRINITY_DN106814_c0_g1~~TRINITY_DN106814_c0_g1_i1.p1  ORF type:complete len:418 (-),score=64.82 TRINITY_DN106814_c0_g1_i1:125-1378(-)
MSSLQCVLDVFSKFDADGNGAISQDELADALTELGMTSAESQDLLASADADKDGVIDFFEFTSWVFLDQAAQSEVRGRFDLNSSASAVTDQLQLWAQSEVLKPNKGGRALHQAAENGQEGRVLALLAAGADLSYRGFIGRRSALHVAACEDDGRGSIIKALCTAPGMDVDLQVGASETTPLQLAAFNGRIENVQALLECGANYALTDTNGKNAVMLAASQGHHKVVEVITAWAESGKTAPTKGSEKTSEVEEASSVKEPARIEAAEPQANAEADAPVPRKSGEALFCAARDGDCDGVMAELKQGADIGYQNSDGLTPLHAAAAEAEGREVIIKALGKTPGVKINMQVGPKQRTALMMAALNGHARNTWALLQSPCNAKWSIKDADDQDAYDLASDEAPPGERFSASQRLRSWIKMYG